MSFQLSSEVDKNKMFMVNRSNLEERFDCEYYSPSIVERINAIKQKPHVKLGEKLKRLQTGYNNLQNDCSGFPFIRTQNVRPIWLDLGKTSLTTDVKVRKSKVGDLLFTRIGVNVGDVGFNATGDFAISDNVILARTNNSDFAKFVAIFLSTELGAVFIEREKRDTARAIISYGNIKKILIPTLSNTNQRKVNAKMDAAYAAKKQKEAEAQALLDSIDDYLLGELGISLPVQQENTLESRIFTRPLSEVSGGRFDPYYFQGFFIDFFKLLEKSKYKVTTLDKIATKITSGITPTSGGDAYTRLDDGVPFIRSGNIDISGEINFSDLIYLKPEIHHTVMKSSKVKRNDLMIAIVGATIGQVGIYLDSREANINQAIALVRLNPSVDCHYIKELIKSGIGQMSLNRLKRPVARANINLEEISTMQVILPPIEKQNEMTRHITQIRQQAKQLQQDAKIGLAQAKKEVEAMILGEGE